MSVTDDHRKSATRSRKVVHPPSPSSAVILSAGAFQPERRISRALYPRPEAKGCRGRAVTFASFSTGVILSAGRFSAGAKDLACTVPAAGGEGMSGSSRHICILLDRRHPERRALFSRSEGSCAGSHPRPERTNPAWIAPAPQGEGISRGSVHTASLLTAVILSAGAVQPERRISRALYPRPEAKGCRDRVVTFASLSTGVILSAGAFQPERRIWRGTASAAGANESRVDRTRAPRPRSLAWIRSHCIPLDRRHPEHRRLPAGAKDLAWTASAAGANESRV